MATALASYTRETPAFSIEEHELVLRWTTLVRHSGYRAVVALGCAGAEELLLVYRPDRDVPAFAIQRLRATVVLIDCLGMTMRFASLAEALLALSPMSKSERQELLHGPRPACLRELPQPLTEQRRSFGSGVVSALRQPARRARRWAARLAAQLWGGAWYRPTR